MSIYDLSVPDLTVYILVILRQFTFLLYVIQVSKELEQEKGTYVELTEEEKLRYKMLFIRYLLTNV
jgi:hypothetical protein